MVLPETIKDFIEASKAMSMRKYHLRRCLGKKYLKLKSSKLDEHKLSKR